jgi:hypothetical protein
MKTSVGQQKYTRFSRSQVIGRGWALLLVLDKGSLFFSSYPTAVWLTLI